MIKFAYFRPVCDKHAAYNVARRSVNGNCANVQHYTCTIGTLHYITVSTKFRKQFEAFISHTLLQPPIVCMANLAR